MTRSLQVLVLSAFVPRCPALPWSSCGITWCKDTPRWHVLHPVPLGPCQWCHPPWTWQYLGFCRTLFLHGGDGEVGWAPACAWVLQESSDPGCVGVAVVAVAAHAADPAPRSSGHTAPVIPGEFPLWKGINAGMPEDTGTVWWLHVLDSLDLKWLVFHLGLL